MVGDRLAVADDMGAVDQHRRLAGRVQPQQVVRLVPRLDFDQLGGEVLLAQDDPNLAAERAQRDVVQAQHGQAEAEADPARAGRLLKREAGLAVQVRSRRTSCPG